MAYIVASSVAILGFAQEYGVEFADDLSIAYQETIMVPQVLRRAASLYCSRGYFGFRCDCSVHFRSISQLSHFFPFKILYRSSA